MEQIENKSKAKSISYQKNVFFKGFVCNLGTGRGSSVLEVIAAFEKANDIEIPFEFAI